MSVGFNPAGPIDGLTLRTDSTTEVQEKGDAGARARGSGADGPTPSQPLPGSSVSVEQMWRMVSKSLQKLAIEKGGNSAEAVKNKKKLIESRRKEKVKSIREQAEKRAEAAEAKVASDALMWVGMGLAVGLACLFGGPMAAVAVVAVMAASMAVVEAADKIMEAAGVDPETRAYVKMGIELAMMLATLPFGGGAGAVGKLASMGAKGARALSKVAKALPAVRAVCSAGGRAAAKGAKMAKSLTKSIESGLGKMQKLMSDSNVSRTVLRRAGGVVQSGCAVGSAGAQMAGAVAQKDLKINKAEADKMEARIEMMLQLIDELIKSVNQYLESAVSVEADQRDFMQTLRANTRL